MHKKKLVIPVVLVVIALFASACSSTLAALPAGTTNEIHKKLLNPRKMQNLKRLP